MPLISILIVFALLYWVGMARIVRSQVLTLKESEYVTAARALGAGTGRIIKKHILTNCIGTLIVTTTLQIPSAIFTESFLSFLGIGVSAPMPSLGSLASTAIDGLQSYPYRLFAPAIADLRRHPQLQPVRRRPARCIRPEAEKLNERKGRTHE